MQKLVDCLNENREETRNDLLLTLLLLVEKYPDIANFIAFQDGFDMLFRILKSETGVTLRDCLKVVYYSIHRNIVTLKLLSQRSYINTIVRYVNCSLLYSGNIPDSSTIDLSVYSLILSRSDVTEPSKKSFTPGESSVDIATDIVRYSISVPLCLGFECRSSRS